jgi:bacillithiol biosynthesis deacetylase BshB1
MGIEVLIVGAHPDDVECGVGGIAALMGSQDVPFTVVDLTRGEMGSRGTPEERAREATAAAKLLGARSRETLDLGDCSLEDSVENRRRVASVIRAHRPRIVFAPFWQDLHNDHAAAGLIVRNSALYCSLSKFDDPNPPHKPALFLYYLLHNFYPPSLIVDITTVFDRKLAAIKEYKSQFSKTAEQYGVEPVGIGDYLFHLESRSRYFGSLANVGYGEPLVSDRPFAVKGLSPLWTLAGKPPSGAE